jgi:ligand-binding sensor domain-containing protein/AraC-like DNA-binding protein
MFKPALNLMLFLITLLGTAFQLPALDPDKPVNQYLLDEWGLDKGFPAGTVYSVTQTPDGYLWLGTSTGLVRYDGRKFDSFVIDDTLKPLERWVDQSLVDKQGVLWLTGNKGVTQYKNGRFKTFSTKDGLSGNIVIDIAEDSYGNLWIGTYGNYLNRFKNGRFTVFNASNGLRADKVNTIYEDGKGVLWVGGNNGLFYVSHVSGVSRDRDCTFKEYRLDMEGSNGSCAVNTIYEDRKHVLWVGTSNGLVKIADSTAKDKRVTIYTTADGLADNTVWSVLEDRNDNLWVGTRFGLHRLKRKPGGRIAIDRCLDDIGILSLKEDSEGSLWIGTFHYGLKRLRDAAVRTLFKQEGIPPYKLSMYKDQTGIIWLGTFSGDLFLSKGADSYEFMPFGNIPNRSITAIYEGFQGDIWLGTNHGELFQVERAGGRIVQKYAGEQDRPGPKINVILHGSGNNLLIGTHGGGMLLYDNGISKSYTTTDGLSGNYVTAIYEDSEKNIWIGTRKGLTVLTNGRWDRESIKTYLPRHYILGIHEDRRGIIWIGTFNTGLIRFKNRTPFFYIMDNGLGSNSIIQILEDRWENLWIASYNGILKVGIKELHELADGRIGRLNCTTFGLSDGMLNVQCVMSSLNSAIKAGEGEFWFATQKGISVVKPGKILVNKSPPPAVIEEILFNGRSIPIEEDGKNFRGIKHVRFYFTAPTFISPEEVKIFYKLEGYDPDWTSVDAFRDRLADYENLPPGDYRFMVTASNADGIRNPTSAAFDFSLKLYAHQTPWFKILSILLATLAALAGFYRLKRYLYIRKLKSKYKNSTLDPEKAESALKKLHYLLAVKKVFKDENLSLKSLASKMGMPPRYLSQVMNEQLNKRFWDVVNGYRVEEAKKMLSVPGKKDYSILEIAFEVGFSSKEVFNRAFKKHTGKTPTQFKKGPADVSSQD